MKNIESPHWKQLEDEGLQPGRRENNFLLIVDPSAKERQTTLEVSMGTRTRMELLPAAQGEMTLFCRYPTGSTDELLSGYVEEGHTYSVCYRAEAEGYYEIWYTLREVSSNVVRFNIIEKAEETANLKQGKAASAPRMAFSMQAPSIGLSTGGAKDINNFSENIDHGYLPLPTDVTYEGLFYCYYFQIAKAKECRKLFCPSYSYAISRDPLTQEPQCYLSVGLDSGITDFHREKINLVVVLDFSGSMSSPFSQYYYDRFGNRLDTKEAEEKKGSDSIKMNIANQAVVDLLPQLNGDDRFGLVIFSDDAFLIEPLTSMADKDLTKLTKRIMNIKAGHGTNMEAGMQRATQLFQRGQRTYPSQYENRIIFLTDAMPNLGEVTKGGLLKILDENAAQGIFTTFVGIGVDFNTELVDHILKIRGANYYTVHSSNEFRKRMNDEFDFMVTPLVFNMQLMLSASGYKIEKVYGSPDAEEATGEILKVSTLFPSQKEAEEIKGGVILIKLKKLHSEGSLKLRVNYIDRNGVEESDETSVVPHETESDFYQNAGIRKAILLSRYADLLKNWIADERAALQRGQKKLSTPKRGVVLPVKPKEWERHSMPLHVTGHYRELFKKFSAYFQEEMKAIGDDNLHREQLVLEKLVKCK
jgi:Ca-activated chloride channel family protein